MIHFNTTRFIHIMRNIEEYWGILLICYNVLCCDAIYLLATLGRERLNTNDQAGQTIVLGPLNTKRTPHTSFVPNIEWVRVFPFSDWLSAPPQLSSWLDQVFMIRVSCAGECCNCGGRAGPGWPWQWKCPGCGDRGSWHREWLWEGEHISHG